MRRTIVRDRRGFTAARALSSLLVALSGTFVAVVLASTPAAAASTYYAKVGGTGTACSSASPCALTEALSIATNGSTVDLAAGTYQPASGASFTIYASVTIQPTVTGSSVILEGNGATVLLVDSSPTTTVSGVTIENGDASGVGGGIDNTGSLTVEGSTISGNVGGDGAGIGNSGILTIEDSTISNNSATYGGGIENFGIGTITVEDSTISGNSANFGLGGGIGNYGTATIESSTISGNSATGSGIVDEGFGGGIYNQDGNPETDVATLLLAGDIIAKQVAGVDCFNSSGTVTDKGFDIDDDGSCGFTATGSVSHSTVIGDYLGALGSNGGPTQTVPLLATPSPTTASPDPALRVIPSTFSLPVAVNGQSLACSVPDQRGTSRQQPCDVGAYELAGTTITFNANGGSGTMAAESGASPTPLTANAFTNGGYVFAGWNTASNGSGTAYANGATYPFISSTTLYAQWAALCSPGYYSTTGGAPCTAAPPGSYVSTSGQLLPRVVPSAPTARVPRRRAVPQLRLVATSPPLEPPVPHSAPSATSARPRVPPAVPQLRLVATSPQRDLRAPLRVRSATSALPRHRPVAPPPRLAVTSTRPEPLRQRTVPLAPTNPTRASPPASLPTLAASWPPPEPSPRLPVRSAPTNPTRASPPASLPTLAASWPPPEPSPRLPVRSAPTNPTRASPHACWPTQATPSPRLGPPPNPSAPPAPTSRTRAKPAARQPPPEPMSIRLGPQHLSTVP